jgi:ribosomal protein S18 acetylase RimI-like enzyme
VPSEIDILPVQPADAGEILTLQRAAYVTEAQRYGDAFLPALTQTYDDLCTELADSSALKALMGGRMVGAIRARRDGKTLHIGRLAVAPDLQGRGIGTRLLTAIEALNASGVETFTLFTGHLSAANIRLYERLGYVQVRREEVHAGLAAIHLDKPVTDRTAG